MAQLTAPEPKCCYRAMGAQQRCSLAWEDRLLPGGEPEWRALGQTMLGLLPGGPAFL